LRRGCLRGARPDLPSAQRPPSSISRGVLLSFSSSVRAPGFQPFGLLAGGFQLGVNETSEGPSLGSLPCLQSPRELLRAVSANASERRVPVYSRTRRSDCVTPG
jgi:hypothetical protein